MAGVSLTDFFLEIGIKADTLKLRDIVSSIQELNLSSILTALNLGGVYEGLKNIMSIGEQSALGINEFAKATGLSSVQMQQFQQFAGQMGSSAQDATSAIKSLQSNALQVLMGQGNAQPFALLGVQPTTDTFKMLDEIHKKFLDPAIPDSIKRMIAGELGLSDSMIAVLKASDAQWNSWKRFQVVSQDNVSVLMQYHQIWTQISQTAGIFFTRLSAEFAPGLIAFGHGVADLTTWISKNIEVVHAWGDAIALVASLYFPLLRIGTIFLELVTHFDQVTKKAKEFYDLMIKVGNAMSIAHVANTIDYFLGTGHKGMTGATGSWGTVTQNNHVTITAPAGMTPADIKKEFDKHMQNEMTSALYQRDNGGKGSI